MVDEGSSLDDRRDVWLRGGVVLESKDEGDATMHLMRNTLCSKPQGGMFFDFFCVDKYCNYLHPPKRRDCIERATGRKMQGCRDAPLQDSPKTCNVLHARRIHTFLNIFWAFNISNTYN